MFATVSNPAHFFSENFDQCFKCCSNNCFLSDAHARLLLQGPPDMGTTACLSLAGHLFLKRFSVPCFHQPTPKMISKWSQHRSKNTLLHNARDLEFCCYLQHFVAIEPPKTTQKVLQNGIKKTTDFQTSKRHHYKLQKGVQMGVYFGGGRSVF